MARLGNCIFPYVWNKAFEVYKIWVRIVNRQHFMRGQKTLIKEFWLGTDVWIILNKIFIVIHRKKKRGETGNRMIQEPISSLHKNNQNQKQKHHKWSINDSLIYWMEEEVKKKKIPKVLAWNWKNNGTVKRKGMARRRKRFAGKNDDFPFWHVKLEMTWKNQNGEF